MTSHRIENRAVHNAGSGTRRLTVRTLLSILMLVACWFELNLAARVGLAAEVTTVLEQLHDPRGVAVQPGTGHVFFAESSAARVVRVVDGKPEPVVVDFPVGEGTGAAPAKCAPAGLLFLGKQTLVVGGCSKSGSLLGVFTVPEQGQAPLAASESLTTFEVPAADSGSAASCYALARSPDELWGVCRGPGGRSWIARLRLGEEQSFGELARLATPEETPPLRLAGGIAISPKGGHVVVAQSGAADADGTADGDGAADADGSWLSFYSQKGELLLRLETRLGEVRALAYAPGDKLYAAGDKLFAAGSAAGADGGGLYQLVASLENGIQGMVAKQQVRLERPTAMAFAADGALWITDLGSPADDPQQPTGKLLKVTW